MLITRPSPSLSLIYQYTLVLMNLHTDLSYRYSFVAVLVFFFHEAWATKVLHPETTSHMQYFPIVLFLLRDTQSLLLYFGSLSSLNIHWSFHHTKNKCFDPNPLFEKQAQTRTFVGCLTVHSIISLDGRCFLTSKLFVF